MNGIQAIEPLQGVFRAVVLFNLRSRISHCEQLYQISFLRFPAEQTTQEIAVLRTLCYSVKKTTNFTSHSH